MCDASFQMPIHHLHEPIDVFSEWLDECEAAEKRNNGMVDDGHDGSGVAAGGGGAMGVDGGDVQRGYDYDSDEEDDLDGGSGLQNSSSAKSNKVQQHSLNSLGVGDSDDDSE